MAQSRGILIFSLLGMSLLANVASAITVRSESDRFRLMYDKANNDDLYNPYGHDFLLDARAHMSDGVLDFIDDADSAANATGTTSEKTTKILAFLDKYKNESYFANARVSAGIPLPTLSFDDWKIVADLRGSYELGASTSITETNGQTFTFGDYTITSPDPIVQLYAKEDIKYGLNVKWFFGETWWMGTDFYVKQRWDRHDIVRSTDILADKNTFDLNKAKNTTSTLDHNFRLGYAQEIGLSWWLGADEVKLGGLSDRKTETGRGLIWGDRPILRANVDYGLDLSLVKITPFFGIHQRSDYKVSDGIYAGVDLGEHLIGIFSGVLMLDNEFFTLNPKIHLWFLDLGYSMKAPTSSEVDGYKTHTIHAANLRLAF